MTLSDKEIAGAIQAAGFPRAYWTTAVAVALAESGGNPNATNHNTNGSTDYGLFQINSIHAELINEHKWADPVDNARMALAISSRGTNWQPWVAYTNGTYRAYLPRARRATGSPVSPPSGSAGSAVPTGLPNPLSGLGGFFSMLTDSRTWLRLGFFVVGGLLILIALAQISGAGAVAKTAAKIYVTKGAAK